MVDVGGAVALFAVGIFLAFKAENKLGYLLMAGGLFWAYKVFPDLLSMSR
jgi:hypothetical protein